MTCLKRKDIAINRLANKKQEENQHTVYVVFNELHGPNSS